MIISKGGGIFTGFSEIQARSLKNYDFFGIEKHKIEFFFITKVSDFVSNLNDDSEASFEVYYVSVSQKLVILGFSPKIFFILTSITSETS